MADPRASSKRAVTPRQLALIGVLAVVLAAVLIAQFGGASAGPKQADSQSAGPKPVAPAIAAPAPKPATASAPAPGAVAPARPPAPPWPKVSADAAAQYDPFAVPEALTRQLAEARKGPDALKSSNPAPTKNVRADSLAALTALRSKGTAAVLRSERGAAAVIGTRVVRVGDVVEGYRVVSIDPQGIMLEPVDPNSPPEKRK
jgi:hypothetical protein